ncbi:uncharacterized protein [Coffea arabica]|uniref:Retrotransposon gag domain-containing protein n=1 Tax=Coffea arabica TaxID=13443 RepID=A0ABM4X0R7_COFAR
MNYLKGQSGGHQDKEPKIQGVELSESRTGSPKPGAKRAHRELTREQVEVVEPSHKNSRTEHPEPVRRFSRGELSPLEERQQVQDELDLLLDPEADRYIASPFVLDIKDYPLPAKFKIPHMKSYDATMDPEDHLFAFMTQMRMQTAADAQRPEESLCEYMVRFNNESLQVRDRDDKVVMAAFINGLRKQKLYTELVERPPKSVREMLDRAHEKANAEEANRLKSAQERQRDDKRRRNADQGDVPCDQGRKNTYDRLPRSRSLGGDKPWTSLTAPRARVLTDCRHLKKDIEKLIKRGHLGQFIRDERVDQRRARPKSDHLSYPHDRPQGPRGRTPEQEVQNLAGVINTIAGGPVGGDSHTARWHNRPPPSGESSSKRLKMYEEIVYGPEDAVPLASNNHETIVIEVITCNYKIKKVYIDNGSAIDVLYYKTFKELQLEDRQFVPVRSPLIGFANPPVRPERMITLMVTVGVSPKCRTVPVNFAVVKEPSSYNMILGRSALNALRTVCSTLHLSMKFSTPTGVAEVLEDPEVVRTCYIATLKDNEKLVAQTACLESWEPK